MKLLTLTNRVENIELPVREIILITRLSLSCLCIYMYFDNHYPLAGLLKPNISVNISYLITFYFIYVYINIDDIIKTSTILLFL
ncbi:hypothetical protein EV146_101385 [Mesobacillus foraminis]|uniref:Uncharacterized protein n=1 Tax=Mesobacillus foraminis TaxID=279826 RepID=A0A4R2BQ36_9BACI|nr:hypothetical protein EV146_101385 [Mesobacillus foraminis]